MAIYLIINMEIPVCNIINKIELKAIYINITVYNIKYDIFHK